MKDTALLLKTIFEETPSKENDFIKFGSNYEEFHEKKQSAIDEWKNLPKDAKAKCDLAKFISDKVQGYEITDGVKNFQRLNEEVKIRKDSEPVSRFLGIDALDCNKSLLDLLEGYENTSTIKRIYKLIKKTVGKEKNSGVDSNEAANIKYCLRQGRELYIAGKQGSYVVKPLNYFYSITAYAYAMILLSNPLRFKLSSIPNNHGIDHKLDYAKISFGGDVKQGTFSEFFMSFPVDFLKAHKRHDEYIDIAFDRSSSIKNFLENRYDTSLFGLFSMVPEMRDIYEDRATQSLAYPLTISHSENKKREYGYEFVIGNGIDFPSDESLQKRFCNVGITHREGKKKIFLKTTDIHNSTATIYTDIYGKLWYIDSPFPSICIPEICLHFLIISALSNIMRYQPEIWGAILTNELDAQLPTFIRYYLTIYEQKFPFLILRSISDYFPVIRESNAVS